VTSAHYHVAIVGTDLCGLVLGALLTKKGYRVLIVGQGGMPLLYEHQGHAMCRRVDLAHGLQAPAIKRVFDELALGLELRNLPRPLEPAFQVVLPRARVQVGGHGPLLERELQREFPGAESAIARFQGELRTLDTLVQEGLSQRPTLPPQGVVETFQFRRLVKRYPMLDDEWSPPDPLAHFPHGHPFRAYVHAPYRFLSGLLPARPIPAAFARTLVELGKGAFQYERGPWALRNLFVDLVAARGDVWWKAAVAEVQVKRGKASHLVLRDRQQTVGADCVVCNTDPKRFFQLVPQEQQDEAFHHQIHTLQPVYYTFVGNFVVRARAIPEAMGKHVFIVGNPQETLEEDNLVHLARDLDAGAATDDREARLLTAAMRVPIPAASGGVETAHELLDKMQRRIEEVVPFLPEHLIARHTPWLGAGADEGGQELELRDLQPAYGEPLPHTLGLSPVATATPYRNVLLGSDAAFCGLGHDGPYYAALALLRQVQERVPVPPGY
jgi:phytoene dehydrogenase-like protein